MKTHCTCRPDCPCAFCTAARIQCEGKRPRRIETEQLALAYIAAYEWYRDREIDEIVFGTPMPVIQ